MLIIITGDINIGKTTVCEKTIAKARNLGYSCGGILTHKISNSDIVIQDLLTGRKKTLVSPNIECQGPRTIKYSFNPNGIQFGIQAIDRGISSDIILIDEIGHLELRGEGFINVLSLIKSGEFKNGIVVIQGKLLSRFLPLLHAVPLAFEVTIGNRNRLPEEIASILVQEAQKYKMHKPHTNEVLGNGQPT